MVNGGSDSELGVLTVLIFPIDSPLNGEPRRYLEFPNHLIDRIASCTQHPSTSINLHHAQNRRFPELQGGNAKHPGPPCPMAEGSEFSRFIERPTPPWLWMLGVVTDLGVLFNQYWFGQWTVSSILVTGLRSSSCHLKLYCNYLCVCEMHTRYIIFISGLLLCLLTSW